MFYKPNYCCHCGEKIERVNWSFTASRRFCEVCQSEFAGRELLPKIFVVLMAGVGIFGFGSYLQSGEKHLNISSKSVLANPSNFNKTSMDNLTSNKSVDVQPQTAGNSAATNAARPNQTTQTEPKQTASAPVGSQEATYFCGASTKKGTPCSRRVKGGGRCWQHQGQTAMLPSEKLIAN